MSLGGTSTSLLGRRSTPRCRVTRKLRPNSLEAPALLRLLLDKLPPPTRTKRSIFSDRMKYVVFVVTCSSIHRRVLNTRIYPHRRKMRKPSASRLSVLLLITRRRQGRLSLSPKYVPLSSTQSHVKTNRVNPVGGDHGCQTMGRRDRHEGARGLCPLHCKGWSRLGCVDIGCYWFRYQEAPN